MYFLQYKIFDTMLFFVELGKARKLEVLVNSARRIFDVPQVWFNLANLNRNPLPGNDFCSLSNNVNTEENIFIFLEQNSKNTKHCFSEFNTLM